MFEIWNLEERQHNWRRYVGRKDFDLIYAYAAGLSMYADERIAKAILPKIELDKLHSEIKNYTGTDSENIQKFYGHFKKNVLEELDAYQSDNQRLREECL